MEEDATTGMINIWKNLKNNDLNFFLYKQIFELKKIDRRPGIEPGSLDYMPSVIPLDHQPSCFSKLFSSHLRAFFYVDACVLHAIIIMDVHAHRSGLPPSQ